VTLDPGQDLFVRISLNPTRAAIFNGLIRFSSNDPKGDVLVAVQSVVVVPDRVFFDFDATAGNQSLMSLELGRDEEFCVQLFLQNLPPLQAVTVELQYDPDILSFVSDSWTIGGFFSGGVPVFEEELSTLGRVIVSTGAFAHTGISFAEPLGQFKFSTPRVLPEGGLETVLM